MATKKKKRGSSTIWVWVAVAAVVGIVILLAMKPAGGPSAGSVTSIDSAAAEKAASDGVRVVDVRTAAEFAGGHIVGAENVPVGDLEAGAASWDKAGPVLVYCATGARSAEAVKILQALGFKDIRHFAQGMVAYTGKVETGEASGSTTVAAAPDLKPTGTPVMYEFYTDW